MDRDHAQKSVLAERRAMGVDRAASADGCVRRGANGRPARYQRHCVRVEKRLPLARLSSEIDVVISQKYPHKTQSLKFIFITLLRQRTQLQRPLRLASGSHSQLTLSVREAFSSI
jgi:hypothetical protein